MHVQLSDVWRALIGNDAEPPAPLAATAITKTIVDSRAAESGTLFVALRGEKTHGNLYVPAALAAGAAAAIAEPQVRDVPGLCATLIEPDGSFSQRGDIGTRGHGSEQVVSPCPPVPVAEQSGAGGPYIFVVPDSLVALQKLAAYWRAQMPAVAIAITGSVGKTTTKETVANVLAQRYCTLRNEGNLNNEVGLPLTLLRLAPEHERAVLEMGMYSLGEIARLCELARPRVGIVTNVGPTHLERLGTIDRIAEAKSELVRNLPPAADGGIAILNADDPRVRAMAGQTRARVFTYGLNEAANLWADEVTSEGLEGIRFRLHYNGDDFHVHLPMLGRHSVHTALRGIAAGLVDGLTWQEILNGLADVSGQLRLITTPGLNDTTLIDDTYNASPVSMLAALNLLEDIANSKHRCIIVLGDMLELGTYEEEGHRLVGGRAAEILKGGHLHGHDHPSHGKLVTVGHRARGIAEEALADGLPGADVYPVETNQDALAVLQGLLQPGDIVLVKGSRGLAMESIVDALSRPREARTA
jgi:UDP-N-acetylmuramoyl-tripeptide--D-alanyl-D-alanine ligase